MTPLAHKIVRELTVPVKHRVFETHDGSKSSDFARKLTAAHCFELTDAHSYVVELATSVAKIADGPAVGFLPAPLTWIEWQSRDDSATRYGFLLEGAPDSRYITRHDVLFDKQQSFLGMLDAPYRVDLATGDCSNWEQEHEGYYADGFHPNNLVPAALLIINSPRVIGRRQHMPHRGLEKKLSEARAISGKFPLRAWTEIRLEVCATPEDNSIGAIAEAHLTGARALHFCRSHLRVRRGQLEVVKAHWRGDPSLGIKRSRYRLEMPS